jgi:hypothetical protein
MKGLGSGVMPSGTPSEIMAAAEAEVAWWLSAARRSTELWRWTAADEKHARVMVGRLGWGDLAEHMTGSDVIVLLALIPHLHSAAHSGQSLAVALQRWLAVPVRFMPHVVNYREIAPQDRSRLGTRYSRLGCDLVLGDGYHESGSTLVFEADLSGADAVKQVLDECWIIVNLQEVRPSDKLVALLEALVPAASRIHWRFLLPPATSVAHWRLDLHRLGIGTRLTTRRNSNA